MRGSTLARALAALIALGLVTVVAAPAVGSPNAVDPCAALPGPAGAACRTAKNIAGGAKDTATFVGDPFGAMASHFAEAAKWLLGKVAAAIGATTQVDFTNPGFLRQYAIVFGAATFLTVILWLVAVGKRAARGAPIGQAAGEAFGFLWLSVAASAFAPLLLSLVVALVDALTEALLVTSGANSEQFLDGIARSLDSGLGGGPLMLILMSLLAIFAGAVIWLELLLRAAMLYIGAVLGTIVFAGLVDRDLWRHVRRWAGVMVAVILAKPILVIILGLASAITVSGGPEDSFSSVLAGLAVMFLSVFASIAVYKFVPTFGDDMAALHTTRRTAASAGSAAAVNGPVGYMRAGIAAHGARRPSGPAGPLPMPAAMSMHPRNVQAPTADGAGTRVAAGIAAHAPARGPNPQPRTAAAGTGSER
jgi:hypothetical protein